MALQPKIRITAAQPTGVLAVDDTGNYDAQANPGGWGAPNPAKAAVVQILLSQANLGTAVLPGAVPLPVPEQANYLTGGGTVLIPLTSLQKDSVYQIRALIGFTCPGTITSVAGALTFSMVNADSIFADAVGFTIDSLSNTTFYAVDRTKPLTGTGGAVTTALPNAAALAVTYYFEADGYGLVFQQGQACLLRDIAKYADTCECCEGEDFDALMTRFAQEMSMFDRFALQDYAGANDLAIKLQCDCLLTGKCSTFVPQPAPTNLIVKPVITVQPSNTTLSGGSNATFTVQAEGTGPLYYQWRKNGIDIPGETGQTLLLLNIQPLDAAQYSVIVWNQYGYDISSSATLTIGGALTPVSITVQPVAVSTTIGAAASFSVTATGDGPITYQWRKNGTNIPGATANVYNIPNVQAGDIGLYDCVVSGPINSVISNAVALSVGVVARWGFADTQPVDINDVNNLQHSGNFTSGGTITASYVDNNAPKFLTMAEPSTEPPKTYWFGAADNQGPIGDPNTNLFIVVGIIGAWRVYTTAYKTQQTLTPIQFKVTP